MSNPIPPGQPGPRDAKAEAAAAKAYAKAKRPWFKKKRFIIPLAFVAIMVIGGAFAGGDEAATTTPAAVAETASAAPTPDEETTSAAPAVEEAEETEAPAVEEDPVVEEEPAETVSQEQARTKAADYLDYSAFSRVGLIKQLKFEGFSKKDATYGVDALDVNWNKQAAKKARDYLDYSSFSRASLIEQLEFEGFTSQQAIYGVNQTGL
jgi:hypothetical protein